MLSENKGCIIQDLFALYQGKAVVPPILTFPLQGKSSG
jgi:hypothetical protein